MMEYRFKYLDKLAVGFLFIDAEGREESPVATFFPETRGSGGWRFMIPGQDESRLFRRPDLRTAVEAFLESVGVAIGELKEEHE